ncbi:unnamed protein product, partial [Arabidopsis halleri]
MTFPFNQGVRRLVSRIIFAHRLRRRSRSSFRSVSVTPRLVSYRGRAYKPTYQNRVTQSEPVGKNDQVGRRTQRIRYRLPGSTSHEIPSPRRLHRRIAS